MAEEIMDRFVLKGIEIGKTAGRVEAEIDNILTLLRHRFGWLPDETVNNVHGRTDLVALKSLDEFAEALK